MHTLIILCCCLGFFMLYNTSKKAKLSTTGKFQIWLQANPANAKKAGVLLLLTSVITLMIIDGVGAGLFTAIILIMAAAGYIIAIAPFYYIKPKHILLLISVSLLMELFIF